MEGQYFTAKTPEQLDDFMSELKESHDWSKSLAIQCEGMGGTRSLKQNNAIHLWFQQLASELNHAGINQLLVLEERSKGVEVVWTADAVKECLYKPLLNAMKGKASTKKMNKTEVGEVYFQLSEWLKNRFLSDHPQLQIPEFPSEEWPDAR